jgi:hypothetical protein
MMHGQRNIKLCIAEQAKRVYQYKNTKIKLHKNSAAIWYNKICRAMSPLSTSALHGRSQRVTIPDAVKYNFDHLKMSILLLETC